MKDPVVPVVVFFSISIGMFLYASWTNNVAIGFGGVLMLVITLIIFALR